MNKLHDALKNEELMLEVGRKATEEQLNQIEIAGVKLKTGKTLECDTPQCKEYVRIAQQKTIDCIINTIENADNDMILDGIKYKNPRLYTIALIKKYRNNTN
jgi:hypothetical protein